MTALRLRVTGHRLSSRNPQSLLHVTRGGRWVSHCAESVSTRSKKNTGKRRRPSRKMPSRQADDSCLSAKRISSCGRTKSSACREGNSRSCCAFYLYFFSSALTHFLRSVGPTASPVTCRRVCRSCNSLSPGNLKRKAVILVLDQDLLFLRGMPGTDGRRPRCPAVAGRHSPRSPQILSA